MLCYAIIAHRHYDVSDYVTSHWYRDVKYPNTVKIRSQTKI